MKIKMKNSGIIRDFSSGCEVVTDSPTTCLMFYSDGYHDDWDTYRAGEFCLIPSWKEIFTFIINKII